jgi:predicted lipid carrier protein YhbT
MSRERRSTAQADPAKRTAIAGDADAGSPRNLAEAVEWFRKRFRSERVAEISVHYRIHLTGAAGGVISVRIEAGELSLLLGEEPGPDVILSLDAEDLYGVLRGELNPDLLLLEERIHIDGNLGLALKLRSAFRGAG